MAGRRCLRELTGTICSEGRLRRIAAEAIKRELDSIFGYPMNYVAYYMFGYVPEYRLDEIEAELEDRLYSMLYLGSAVKSIVEARDVETDVKKRLARLYLCCVKAFAGGSCHPQCMSGVLSRTTAWT